MSMRLDNSLLNHGTKFSLYAQPRFVLGFSQPEVVFISVPPGQIQPGPADDRFFVIDAIGKAPYDGNEIPPYLGPKNAPPLPGPDGHYDHLVPGTRDFSAAHMYATVRRVLDIWEDYFGHPIQWHFEIDFARMLLIPRVNWDNAQSGYGFMEFGFPRKDLGLDLANPYSENFDVLAHELGHAIIFSQVGFPDSELEATPDYGGFHESAGDLAALVAVLHFNSVVDRLLLKSAGNLFTRNELERVGELADNDQVRLAFNNVRMQDVGNGEEHDRSQPLTGALFDIFVEIFQKNLVAGGLISQALADRSFHDGNSVPDDTQIQLEFSQAYAGHEAGFKDALLAARDIWGHLLAKTWGSLRPNNLTYGKVAAAVMAADRSLNRGNNAETIRRCFVWRGISMLSNRHLATPHRLF